MCLRVVIEDQVENIVCSRKAEKCIFNIYLDIWLNTFLISSRSIEPL